MKRIAWVLAAAIAALVLAVAACGGDDDEGSSGDSGGAANSGGGAAGGPVKFAPGKDFKSVFIPKQTGIAVFDQANDGAKQAAGELQVDPAQFLGPSSPDNCVSSQIDTVTNATTQGAKGVMISNCAGDQIEPAVNQAAQAGAAVVSWDSPVPSGKGESVFVAQVDFNETGKVMADLANDILGPEGGEYAILSAAPDAANQNAWIKAHKEAIKDPKYKNLKLVDTVYGNDDSEKSYDEALGLVDKHPNLKLIMAPTTVGIAAAGKAMTDEKLCDKVKVSGLGLPEEMKAYTLSGCAPKFALWSFKDLGYLAFYAAYGIGTKQIEAKAGTEFEAGHLGKYKIEKDPTRDNGLRILMGPFTVYDKANVEGG
jgi:rhamnose transport system substrate-binding protein